MRGRNYSKKRQAIYDLMCSTKEHPSAEWVYNKLKSDYPDLSLGTVYRNMKLLEEQGMLKSVAVVDGCGRYDAYVKPHSHFVCSECGKILDVHVSFDAVDRVNIEGVHRIDSHNLVYYGICTDCGKDEA